MRKYGVKYRTIFDKNMDIIKNVYSPVLYMNKEEVFVSNGNEILEFNSREEALLKAKEIYIKFKNKNIDLWR